MDQSSAKTVYSSIFESIREQIIKGQLGPGEQLPTEYELVKQYHASRSSVRRAIELLAREGLVETIHGKGSFICDWKNTQSKGGIIGLLVPDRRRNFFLNVIEGVETAAKSRDFFMVFSYLGNDENEESQTIRRMRDQNVAGFIIYPKNYVTHDGAIWQLFKENFPFVLIDRHLPDLPSAFVGIDNFRAAYTAVEYLIHRGHREIGFASLSDLNTTTIHDRYAGYLSALNDHGIAFAESWLFQSPSVYSSPVYTDDEGIVEINNFRTLFKQKKLPTAIFAINDITAYLIYKAAKVEGIRIPEDLSLVGFDDDNYARATEPPLTTIAQPFKEIGVRAAHLLIDKIRGVGSHLSLESVLLPTRLVIRQSCGES